MLLFLLTLAIEVVVLAIIFSFLDLAPLMMWLIVGTIALGTFGLFEAMRLAKQATMAVASLNKLVLAATIISVGLASAYLTIDPDNPLGLLSILVISKLVVLLMFIPWRTLHGLIRPSFDSLWTVARIFFVYGFPLSLAFTGQWIMAIANRYFLEYFRGTTEVGLYSAGYEVFFKLLTLSMAFIGAATMPHMMKSFDLGEKEEVERIFSKTIYLLLILLAPLTGFMIIYGSVILNFILGEAYSVLSSSIIQLVTIGAFFWIMTVYQFRLLMLVKKTNHIAFSCLFCAFLNVIGNYLLIPKYGMQGAALSTAVSYLVLLFLTHILARRHFLFATKTVLASALFLGAGLLCGWLSQLLGGYWGLVNIQKDNVGTFLYLGGSFILTFILFQFLVLWNKNVRIYEFSFIKNLCSK